MFDEWWLYWSRLWLTVRDWDADEWAVVVQLLAALGTFLAVVVALWTTMSARRDADRRALADRAAFAARQREEHDHDRGLAEQEREHNRRTADARWRLDLLLRISEEYERVQGRQQIGAGMDQKATLAALIAAYPGDLPVLRAYHFDTSGSWEGLRELARQYGDVSGVEVPQGLCRMEVAARLAMVRQELFDEGSKMAVWEAVQRVRRGQGS